MSSASFSAPSVDSGSTHLFGGQVMLEQQHPGARFSRAAASPFALVLRAMQPRRWPVMRG